MNQTDRTIHIDEMMRSDHPIESAARTAVRDALLDHKRSGYSIVVWEDGRVKWIPAEQIEVDEPAGPADGATGQ